MYFGEDRLEGIEGREEQQKMNRDFYYELRSCMHL